MEIGAESSRCFQVVDNDIPYCNNYFQHFHNSTLAVTAMYTQSQRKQDTWVQETRTAKATSSNIHPSIVP